MPFSGRTYDPDLLAAMGRALDEAWREAEAQGVAADLDATDARKAMALLIMAAVDEGLRDSDHLKRVALGAIDDQGAINGDVRAAQAHARHANPQTTMRYDDNRQDLAGKVAAGLAAALSLI